MFRYIFIALAIPLMAHGQSVQLSSEDGAVNESIGSIQEAVARASSLRAEGQHGALTITLKPATYRLDQPIVLHPEHSGTWDAPLVFKGTSDGSGHSTLSGGLEIVEVRVEDGVWVTNWYERAGGPTPLSAIWINGEFREPARTPNEGYLYTAGKAPATTDAEGNEVSREKTAFVFAEGDIKAWPDMDQAIIRAMHSWDVSHNRIATIDDDAHIVNLKIPVTWSFEHWGPKQRYIVQHVREAFDAPGEWYLDQQTGLLYYRPLPGETIDNVTITAPRIANIVRIEGKPAENRFVEHIHFEDIVFAHTNYPIPAQGHKDDQAAYPVDAAIQAVGARHVVVERCEVTQTSNYGIWFSTGCTNNRVESCSIHHLGAGGVRLGHMNEGASEAEHAGHNTAINNAIYDGGYVFPEGIGVWVGRSSYNRVAHNSIHDFYYTGVSVGWSWGYADSTANHNTVEFNEIHDIGKAVLSDMGAVYLLGKAPGTIIRNNVVQDIDSFKYGGWGLYTDEGSSDVLMENNIVYNTKTGGFHQHYGRDNRIQNNIFAFARNDQIMRSREEEHISFYFTGNIVYFDNRNTLGSTWKNDNFVMDRNTYFSTAEEPILFKEMTFAEWQARGHDRHSQIADPKFVDPANRDFGLHPDSPAIKAGFRPIDTSLVGPRTTVGPRGN